MKLGYETIQKINRLVLTEYGYSTCFDYIDEITDDSVTIFVEPAGNITIHGNLDEVLDLWHDIFLNQPSVDIHMGYAIDGNLLWSVYEYEVQEMPKTGKLVWEKAIKYVEEKNKAR